MGRPPKKARLLEERKRLAALIDAALKQGRCGDGTAREQWESWTETAFAAKLGTGASSISDWRDPTNPTRPTNIKALLREFYGDNPLYADDRQEMLTAWRLAGGIDAEDPPDPRHIVTHDFTRDVAEIVTLLVNQPTSDNHGKMQVPYTLRMRCDEGIAIDVKVDGKTVPVVMDIGLTKPLFCVESDHWQPVQDTVFRAKKHNNTLPGPSGDSVQIVGERDNHGRIAGEPLADEPHLTMEPKGIEGDGPITLSVKAPRDGFHVTLANEPEVTAMQKDVIDAIFALGIKRDHRDRLEITRTTITLRGPIPSQ